MSRITPERVTQLIVQGINKAVARPWLSGLTEESTAVLLACREVIISDPGFAAAIAAKVGPFNDAVKLRPAHGDGPPVTGDVETVYFHPGRDDGLLSLTCDCGTESNDAIHVPLQSKDGEARLTVDGATVNAAALVLALFDRRMTATAWPRLDRYGAATRADFKTMD